MAINTITYSDKSALNVNANIPDINKVKADDMNEIKQVVNDNATAMGDVSTLKTNTTTDIVAGVNSIMDGNVYSTAAEVKTNEIYMNGKPLYRKCVHRSVAANTEERTLLSDYGITNQDIVIVNIGKSTAHYANDVGGSYSPITYNVGTSDYNHVYVDGAKKLVIKNASTLARDYYVVLEYTKTTD